jgi:hypothetical protein
LLYELFKFLLRKTNPSELAVKAALAKSFLNCGCEAEVFMVFDVRTLTTVDDFKGLFRRLA